MRQMLAALCLIAPPVAAEDAPRVVADIAPIYSLVTQMMRGAGTPSQIIPTGASPHGYAMRPSEARALRDADLVVWVGPALTHWLEEPLDTLAGDAARLTLMSQAGTKTLPMREAVKLLDGEEHDHDHDDDHEGHGHDGDVDPHGWLAPSNAVLWAGVIAQTLEEMDAANAAIYTANWEDFRNEMADIEQELTDKLRPYRDTSFIVLHDAFHYFEATFGVEADAFIVPGDGSTPGPAQIKALRDYLAENPATCAFTAPQENDSLLRTVIEGQGTRIAVLDSMGDGITPYATLIREFADDMVACLSQG
ncbi:zinc ABC transporter substrate-binding protein [uncultured Sulfitobacter sp.]|uniref:zinc ABC transporter substrate-binding protein n=1 Tax=uncultured Sulfitobacter sp. TaxID=191468 RepID=UPI002620A66D|nr:zinc ABC transporter substrate-binding protein [uncultured Sulfitobacter sp.]